MWVFFYLELEKHQPHLLKSSFVLLYDIYIISELILKQINVKMYNKNDLPLIWLLSIHQVCLLSTERNSVYKVQCFVGTTPQ